jgi:hypothetical protein
LYTATGTLLSTGAVEGDGDDDGVVDGVGSVLGSLEAGGALLEAEGAAEGEVEVCWGAGVVTLDDALGATIPRFGRIRNATRPSTKATAPTVRTGHNVGRAASWLSR